MKNDQGVYEAHKVRAANWHKDAKEVLQQETEKERRQKVLIEDLNQRDNRARAIALAEPVLAVVLAAQKKKNGLPRGVVSRAKQLRGLLESDQSTADEIAETRLAIEQLLG